MESSEGVIAPKPVSGVCCSCSKKSLCKTSKCGCRAAGGSCGTSCGCAASKCSNRGAVINEIEKSSVLASQDAMLFQNTLIEKPSEMKDDCGPKKQALKEIGNIPVLLQTHFSFFLFTQLMLQSWALPLP